MCVCPKSYKMTFDLGIWRGVQGENVCSNKRSKIFLLYALLLQIGSKLITGKVVLNG